MFTYSTLRTASLRSKFTGSSIKKIECGFAQNNDLFSGVKAKKLIPKKLSFISMTF